MSTVTERIQSVVFYTQPLKVFIGILAGGYISVQNFLTCDLLDILGVTEVPYSQTANWH